VLCLSRRRTLALELELVSLLAWILALYLVAAVLMRYLAAKDQLLLPTDRQQAVGEWECRQDSPLFASQQTAPSSAPTSEH
jgi:hypothetical protein